VLEVSLEAGDLVFGLSAVDVARLDPRSAGSGAARENAPASPGPPIIGLGVELIAVAVIGCAVLALLAVRRRFLS